MTRSGRHAAVRKPGPRNPGPRHRADLELVPIQKPPKAIRAVKALVLTSAAGLVLGGMLGTNAAGRFGVSDISWQDSGSEISAMIEAHGCWQGPPPPADQGRVPGHVVVRVAPGQAVVYSEALVSAALEHLANDAHPEMTVYAFCR